MRRLAGKPLVWLHGEVLSLPHSRPMPALGRRCHELRVVDERATWRIVYRVDADAIVIVEVFAKKSQATPRSALDACGRRLRAYDRIAAGRE